MPSVLDYIKTSLPTGAEETFTFFFTHRTLLLPKTEQQVYDAVSGWWDNNVAPYYPLVALAVFLLLLLCCCCLYVAFKPCVECIRCLCCCWLCGCGGDRSAPSCCRSSSSVDEVYSTSPSEDFYLDDADL